MPPRTESRGEGPPRKAWDKGEATPSPPAQTMSQCQVWWDEGLVPSFPASALGLLCPGCGRKPSAPPPKGYFPTAAWEEAPEPGREEGSRALSRALHASPINPGRGRLQDKTGKRSHLWQPQI